MYKETWLEEFYILDYTNTEIYYTSFYWTITTITTVGYGEIHGNSPGERMFCALIMIIGVVSFSFANGSLASILSNYDVHNAALQDKIAILNKVYKDYRLPLNLYVQCKKHLEYNNKGNQNEIQGFIEDLPHKLSVQMSLYIHEARYKRIKFFKKQPNSFISWLCPLLKPYPYSEN